MGSGVRRTAGRRWLKLYAYAIAALMTAPILITLPVALTTTGYIAFPPVGLTLQWFARAFQDAVLLHSLILSVDLAIVSACVAVALSLLASFAIERQRFPGRDLLETLFAGPQMVPQIILVLGLLIVYHKAGLSGTFLGLLLSHVVIALPFAFRTLLASVATLDRRLEWSASILGASRPVVLWRVIFPQMKTGIIAAFVFTFMISFTNFTMALFLAAVGKTTLPVEMFNRFYVAGMTPAIPALSFLLGVLGVAIFIAADRTVGVYKYLGGGGGQ
jgi:putative spermidine/putrescine transport system permease protein